MKKILVVDDDADILYVVELILSHYDFDVKITGRWSVISKTVKQFNPDLILLDIDLGGADGSEICKELKQSKETQKVPVILFSAHHMPEEYVKECNAQGFLIKPFEPSDLVKIVRENVN